VVKVVRGWDQLASMWPIAPETKRSVISAWSWNALPEKVIPRKDPFDLPTAPARKIDVVHRHVEHHPAALVEIRIVGRREIAARP
jgi:hypothetical protein